MIIKGKSRGNGAQLADYLTKTQDNANVQVLEIRGTAKINDLKKSLLEMSLSSLQTKGDKGLYHAQVNPRDNEAERMTTEDWLRAADILEGHLKLKGQKRAIVLHDKNGRTHAHIVWERYDHDKGRLREDSHNYKAHDKARADIEREFSHERTPNERDKSKEPSHKKQLTALWQEVENGREFIERASTEGYIIARGLDRRPFKVITPEGVSLDLVKQLQGVKTRDVVERLRGEILPIEAKALQDKQKENEREPEKHAENERDISDSQDLMLRMKAAYQQEKKEPPKTYSYSFKFEQPLFSPEEPEKRQPDSKRDLDNSQDLAAAMLEKYRNQAKQEQKLKQEREEKAEQLLQEIRRNQEQRRRNRDKGLDMDL